MKRYRLVKEESANGQVRFFVEERVGDLWCYVSATLTRSQEEGERTFENVCLMGGIKTTILRESDSE